MLNHLVGYFGNPALGKTHTMSRNLGIHLLFSLEHGSEIAVTNSTADKLRTLIKDSPLTKIPGDVYLQAAVL